MTKYKAKKTEVDGIVFASKRESQRYLALKLMQKAGLIYGLTMQPKFELQPSFKKNGKTYRAISYIADFAYYNCMREQIIEDTKGFITKEFAIKQKMFEHKYPDLKLEIVE